MDMDIKVSDISQTQLSPRREPSLWEIGPDGTLNHVAYRINHGLFNGESLTSNALEIAKSWY